MTYRISCAIVLKLIEDAFLWYRYNEIVHDFGYSFVFSFFFTELVYILVIAGPPSLISLPDTFSIPDDLSLFRKYIAFSMSDFIICSDCSISNECLSFCNLSQSWLILSYRYIWNTLSIYALTHLIILYTERIEYLLVVVGY